MDYKYKNIKNNVSCSFYNRFNLERPDSNTRNFMSIILKRGVLFLLISIHSLVLDRLGRDNREIWIVKFLVLL